MLVNVSGSRDKWTNGQTDKGSKDRVTNGPMENQKKNIAFSESPCHETSRKRTKNNIRRSKNLLYNN